MILRILLLTLFLGAHAVAGTPPLPPGQVKDLFIRPHGAQISSPINQENRIQLVFLGDGYTADQADLFYKIAQEKLDYLMGSEQQVGIIPFRAYRNYFVGKAIFVPSKQSGACHPEKSQACPNTIYGVHFNQSNIPRLLGLSPVGSKQVDAALRKYVPDYDLATIITNDQEYGGAGGSISIISANESSNEVIAHELMGHSFSHLGDEYTDPYPGYPDTEEVNTTKNGNPETVKWKEWISLGLISTPFEGAHYHEKDWFRPAENCKMRGLGSEFCHVCVQGIVRSIYNKVRPIDDFSPKEKKVNLKSSDEWAFRVSTMKPKQGLKIRWFINGQLVNSLTAETRLDRNDFERATMEMSLNPKEGKYKIQAQVIDPTPLVNAKTQDPLLTETQEWQLNLKK